MTLSQAIVTRQGLPAQALLVLAGSALIAVAAKISVPMLPVSMTLQTLAILVVGLSFGARLGALTLVAYLAQGAAGLPVFSPTTAPGLAAFAGPTAGFLFGFVLMAAMAGWASDRGLTRRLPGAVAAAVAASVLLYVPGLAWPALAMGKSVPDLLSGWMLPFLAGDAVKAVLAALVVTGAWTALGARRG
ncbi:MAG TPA: biotin transporter BioY [Paracoccaceae bacterium]|nr:biotin transporter BioY [Paracoccaceae bacterium]HMO73260.1 biotin transporter BioY [Paracoccaceae bacterium]